MNVDQINERLKAQAADPVAFMKQLPYKWDADGLPAPVTSAFDATDIQSRRFVTAADEVRRQIFAVQDGVIVALEDVMPGRAPFEQNDLVENLADRVGHRTLASIAAAGLTEATLPESPWSDDYWAIYLGQLGKRYADPEFPHAHDWQQNHNYVLDFPATDIVASGDPEAINRLSPAEKYDLLVGDAGFGLTSYGWAQGRSYYEKKGEVETWMGLCHGWAPAAYMLPRPRKSVEVLAADGQTKLTFYPADIKALATQLWAKARTVSRFIGGRCNDKDPVVDENGRPTSSRCFDTNPGTWHLAVVNQIGVAKRSFVLDATYDYEVWNQPAHAYRYHHVHPVTHQVAPIEEAIVPIDAVAGDRFARYRSPRAKFLCGIHMQLAYVVETSPRPHPDDSPARDAIRWVEYVYDLELDADGRIIGGEWHQAAHPDFLWTPPPGVKAISPADRFSPGRWDDGEIIPTVWRLGARNASSQGLPLARVVEGLIERANRPE
jgi:hypothetical protein